MPPKKQSGKKVAVSATDAGANGDDEFLNDLANALPANDNCPSDMPSIPIEKQFPQQNYPLGEICEYPTKQDKYVKSWFDNIDWLGLIIFSTTTLNRMTNEEKKALDRSYEEVYHDFRRAAEAHRQAN